MKETDVIIVGAGPAGATCAGRLKKYGVDFVILDKAEFPRDKPCAGWVSPGVFKLIDRFPTSYPHSIHMFRRIVFHFPGFTLPVKTIQYSIRRPEFDHWLLKIAGVTPIHHKMQTIRKEEDYYIVDNQWKARILVGAGGTHCPVRQALFPEKEEASDDLIIGVATEAEMKINMSDCHLWFFERGISGYSWFLPKGNQKVNIGIGARFHLLKSKGEKITDHWDAFLMKIMHKGWIEPDVDQPHGHYYYLQQSQDIPSRENAYLIGDAARLSTLDLGEGIYNSIRSGAMLANFIAGRRSTIKKAARKYSFPGILFPFL